MHEQGRLGAAVRPWARPNANEQASGKPVGHRPWSRREAGTPFWGRWPWCFQIVKEPWSPAWTPSRPSYGKDFAHYAW